MWKKRGRELANNSLRKSKSQRTLKLTAKQERIPSGN
jgi:hypothetical protein